jgi:hypothetical protein
MFKPKTTTFSSSKNTNTKNTTRIKTNLSLTELVESSQRPNQRPNPRPENPVNNQTNYRNPFFKAKSNKEERKEQFKIKNEDFPLLISGNTTSENATSENATSENATSGNATSENATTNYSEKLKARKVEQENYKLRLSKKKEYKKEQKEQQEEALSEYYNPMLSLKILNDRLESREALNEILGDLSPYWNKTIEEESTDLEEDEKTSENDDEYNNAILEEW